MKNEIEVNLINVTTRELFAVMIAQGLCANLAELRKEGFRDNEIELFAVMKADALIAELEKPRQE